MDYGITDTKSHDKQRASMLAWKKDAEYLKDMLQKVLSQVDDDLGDLEPLRDDVYALADEWDEER